MDSIEPVLKARMSYELGRLRVALPGVILAVVIAAFVLVAPHPPAAPWLGLALGLLALLGGLWRRAFLRAVVPGLLAGLIPLLAPTVALRVGMGCGLRDCTALCIVTCLVSGVAAGLVIGRLSQRIAQERRTFLLVAGGLGTLVGSMTCLQFGAVGLGLLALGYMASVVPSWLGSRVVPTS
jgi:hypothetical protein